MTALPTGTTSGMTQRQTETRYVFHGWAPVYYPAPNGGSYCNGATCTHDHPDTEKGIRESEECAERLARIIATGRLPQWAKLDAPI